MSKRLYMDFVDQNGEACFVDAFAIDFISPVSIKGRQLTYSALCIGAAEITVEGTPTEILKRLVKASTDEYHLAKFGFVPGEPGKGGA